MQVRLVVASISRESRFKVTWLVGATWPERAAPPLDPRPTPCSQLSREEGTVEGAQPDP